MSSRVAHSDGQVEHVVKKVERLYKSSHGL